MLVAEVVAEKLGQKLDFGDWDGDGQGREWCRALRQLVDERGDTTNDEADQEEADKTRAEQPKAVQKVDSDDEEEQGDGVNSARQPKRDLLSDKDSDDDSLVGYGSNASSRSPSPTPSELDEIEKDPRWPRSKEGPKASLSHPTWPIARARRSIKREGRSGSNRDGVE